MRALLLLTLTLMAGPALAHKEQDHGGAGKPAASGEVRVMHAWARATPPGAANGAAYLQIHNGGAQADRLVGADSDRSRVTELHTVEMKDGVAAMVQLDAVPLAAGETVRFEPGGRHVMLIALDRPLKEGEHFQLTLRLERGGEVKVPVEVRAIGTMGGGHKAH